MPRVTFMPDDVTVEVRQGENLLRAAMAANVVVNASCGGEGTCGKCRVIVEKGAVISAPNARLSEEQIAEGHVLACSAAVDGCLVVRVPPESRPGRVPERVRGAARVGRVISAEEFEARIPKWELDPPVSKRLLEMTPPDLTDNASDAARMRSVLRRQHGIKDVEITWPAMRKLADSVRAGDWTATAVIRDTGCGWRLVDVEPGDTTDTEYVVAVDVGTTTIEAMLVDMATGETIAQASEYNAQVAHGDDVISRIIYGSRDKGLEDLHALVVKTIRNLVEGMAEQVGVSLSHVVGYMAAGNTVMTQLLLGLSPRYIREEPYIPTATTFPWVRAEELGLPGSPEARVCAMPCPASYVGGDITAGVLASGIPWTDHLSLYIDVGTNGEIVLGNKEWLVSCSCSAGPAFEGGGVLHGMRAADGAIEQIRIDRTTLEPMLLTIGQTRPIGICGSGLIDAVSELFLAGAIDRTGKFDRSRAGDRIRDTEHGWAYVLSKAEMSGTGADILVTEADIDNLVRAKAAIFAGISVLMESVDVTFSDIHEVLVAGAFGHYLELDKVVTLGLLPELAPERFRFVGNGSLLGARLAAMSRQMTRMADNVAHKMTYLELSVNAAFMEMYVSALFLPHTDLALFPGVEARLKSRAGR